MNTYKLNNSDVSYDSPIKIEMNESANTNLNNSLNSNFYDTSGSTYSKQRMMSMTNQTEMENFAKSLFDLNIFFILKFIKKSFFFILRIQSWF